MRNSFSGWSCFGLLLCFSIIACQSTITGVLEIDDLANPGRGWTTFYSVNSDKQNNRYPVSSIAYYRFTWRQAEPVQGEYAFEALDGYIAKAKVNGQRFAFRIMPDTGESGVGIPDWLFAKGINGWSYTGTDGSSCFSPDPADSVYLQHALDLINAFGARYDGDPDIDHVDIGLVGDFGEWHLSLAATQGAVMPSYEIRTQYIDAFVDAFPTTSLLMLVGGLTQTDADTLSYALAQGTGWRADAWGDFRSPWNHMEDSYPLKIAMTSGITEAWRTKPVALETYGVPSDWYFVWPDRIEEILQFAIDNHVSILNAKSSAIPDAWVKRFRDFTSHIGYRYALSEPPFVPDTADRGATVSISLAWINLGNAPIYQLYQLALRFVQDDKEIARAVSAVDVRTWMPFSVDGVTYPVDFAVSVPADASLEVIQVQLALLDPISHTPAIQCAMEGRNADLWYDIGTIDPD